MRPVLYPKAYRGLTVMIVALICLALNTIAFCYTPLIDFLHESCNNLFEKLYFISYHSAWRESDIRWIVERMILLSLANLIPELVFLIGLNVAKQSDLKSFVQGRKLYLIFYIVHSILTLLSAIALLFQEILPKEFFQNLSFDFEFWLLALISRFRSIIPVIITFVFVLVLKGCREGTDNEVPTHLNILRVFFFALSLVHVCTNSFVVPYMYVHSFTLYYQHLFHCSALLSLIAIIPMVIILIRTKKIMYR